MAYQNRDSQPGDGQLASQAGSQGGSQGGSQSSSTTEPRDGMNPSPSRIDGDDERRGEGGYGNDTGFATGTAAPRDDDADDRSVREQQTADTYRDAGQGKTL